MKFKLTVLLATCVVTMGLLLGTSSQAATVDFSGNTATGVRDVICGDVPYDVEFVFQTGISLYGDEPPEFPFKGASGDAEATAEEQSYACSRVIQEALNAASQAITRVGPQQSSYFLIGVGEEEGETELGGEGSAGDPDPSVWAVFESRYYDDITTQSRPADTWVPADNFSICLFDCIEGERLDPFPFGSNTVQKDVQYSWAKLVPASGSSPPPPASVGGSVTGLQGDGLVLQNNGTDNEPIAANGNFTFNTQLAVGTSYSVTVQTQPSNPAQFCSVANGWGNVPAGGVDDVLVTCGDVPEARTVPRYRLYNPNTFIHFFTTDANEYDSLGNSGWNQEGISSSVYDAVITVESVEAIPYFRLYNPATGVHFWTTDANEYDSLGNTGWNQEGEDGYIMPSQVSNTVPWYRLFNPNEGLHFWTLDANERNALIDAGYNDEGIDGYVFLP